MPKTGAEKTAKKERAADPMYGFWRAMHHEVGGVEACTVDHPELKSLKIATVAGSPAAAWEQPQCGLWKIKLGGHYEDGVKQPRYFQPLQVWLCDPDDPERKAVRPADYRPGLKLVGMLDIDKPVEADKIASLWLRATFLSVKERDFYRDNGRRWPSDPPPPTDGGSRTPARDAATDGQTPRQGEAATPPVAGGTAENPKAVAGDNSGDLDAFRKMRGDLLGEIAEATAYFRNNPIANLDQAHKCENWADRIRKLTQKADKMREDEKAPFLEKCNEIQGRWKPLVDDGTVAVRMLTATGDAWARAETERRRKAAEAEAAATLKADQERQEAERQAALDRNTEIEAEREDMEVNDPIAALTGSLPEFVEVPPPPQPVAAPVVVVEAVQIGTARKRTAGKAAPATAIITSLKDAAVHLAALGDRDLIALVKKRADASAKTGVAYPGTRLSTDVTNKEAAE